MKAFVYSCPDDPTKVVRFQMKSGAFHDEVALLWHGVGMLDHPEDPEDLIEGPEGWYWSFSAPDTDDNGPFATEEEAVNSALEASQWLR